MKRLTALVLFACIGPASARSATPTLNDPTEVAAIRQLEKDMHEALVAVDIGKLDPMFADDWLAFATSGKIVTKENILSELRSGNDKLLSYELGPMDVQVLGDVAVFHASLTEKRIRDGKDVSGQYVFMDLLKKRGGKWVLVRSGGASVR